MTPLVIALLRVQPNLRQVQLAWVEWVDSDRHSVNLLLFRPRRTEMRRRNFKIKRCFHSVHVSNVFRPPYSGGSLKTQQSPVILKLCLMKTRAGKSLDYRDGIVFEKLRFQNVFRPNENVKPAFSNSSSLKSIFEKLRFRDGLARTEGLTVEIKLRFRP